MKKRFLSLALAAAMSLTLVTPALAAETADAQVRNYFVVVEEQPMFRLFAGKDTLAYPIAYEDRVYIPLVTVGQWLGADTSWDRKDGKVTLTSNGEEPFFYDYYDSLKAEGMDYLFTEEERDKPFQAELVKDVTVTLDGKAWPVTDAQGQAIPLLALRDCLFLPVETVARKMGKELLKWSGDLFLYDAPTQEELDQANACLDEAKAHLDAVRGIAEGEAPKTQEEFTAKVLDIQSHLAAVMDQAPPQPAFRPLQSPMGLPDLKFWATLTLMQKVDPYLPEEACSGAYLKEAVLDQFPGQQRQPVRVTYLPTQVDALWERFSASMVTTQPNTSTNFMETENAYERCRSFLRAVTGENTLPDAPAWPQQPSDAGKGETVTMTPADPTEFTDAAQITYWDAVATLTQLGIVSGRPDGAFDPAAPVTRGEAAKLVATAMCGSGTSDIPAPKAEPTFPDTKGCWAEAYIEYCADLGILSGRGDGNFDPDGNVTALELCKMALTMLGYDAAAYRLTGSDWADRTDELARRAGLYSGFSGLAATAPISREETAQLLCNALQATHLVVKPDGTGGWKYESATNRDGTPQSFFKARYNKDVLPEVPAQPKTDA